MDFCYSNLMLGQDEPSEMWLTGNAAIEFMKKMGEPLIDKNGDPINPKGAYYISVNSGGLIPF